MAAASRHIYREEWADQEWHVAREGVDFTCRPIGFVSSLRRWASTRGLNLSAFVFPADAGGPFSDGGAHVVFRAYGPGTAAHRRRRPRAAAMIALFQVLVDPGRVLDPDERAKRAARACQEHSSQRKLERIRRTHLANNGGPVEIPLPNQISPALADDLRAMNAIARTVNGATAADDPRRRVSEKFTSILAGLVGEGVTIYRLAKILGVTQGTVYHRLARHGYRASSPSMRHQVYRNRSRRGRVPRSP